MFFTVKIDDPVLHVHIVTNRNVAIAEENLNAPVFLLAALPQVIGLLVVKKNPWIFVVCQGL